MSIVKRNWGKMIGMALLMVLAYAGAWLVMSLITGIFANISVGLAGLISLVVSVAIGIAGCGLTLGYNAALLNLHDDKTVRVTDVFNCLDSSLPAFGLSLWISLWVFLWMLPGMGVMLLGGLIGGLAESEAILLLLMIIGCVVVFVCIIRAAFSYALAFYVLADNPTMGVIASLNMSKSLMNGYRWQLFCLTVPYMLVSIAVSLGVNLLTALLFTISADLATLFSIIGMLLMVAAAIIISLLTQAAQASFYRALTPAATPADDDGFGVEQSTINFDF